MRFSRKKKKLKRKKRKWRIIDLYRQSLASGIPLRPLLPAYNCNKCFFFQCASLRNWTNNKSVRVNLTSWTKSNPRQLGREEYGRKKKTIFHQTMSNRLIATSIISICNSSPTVMYRLAAIYRTANGGVEASGQQEKHNTTESHERVYLFSFWLFVWTRKQSSWIQLHGQF